VRFFTQRLNLDKRYRNAVNKKYFEPGRASVRALEDEIRNFTDYINSEGPFNGKGYVAATRLSETSIDLVLATVDCTEKDAECLFDVMKNGLENIVIPESKYSSSKFNEITNGSFDNYMNAAEHHNLVDDSDEYSMYLGDYAISSQRGFRHGEVIIDMKTKAQIYSDAKKSIAPANLTNELDNIYSYPSNENVKGHPIHYIIRTDDLERRKFIYKPLLSALYNNKRIVSRRYLFFDAGENTINYDNLYKNLTDCTVVIRFNSDTLESGDEICSFNQEIYEICESIKKYRNQVLTVLVLPIKADGIMEILADNLQDMSFVSIEEENLSHKEALKVLRTLAKEYSTTIDNSIKTRLDKDKTYSVDELNNIFNEWYNNHIKESYFPCYSDSMTFNKEMFKKEVKAYSCKKPVELVVNHNNIGVKGENFRAIFSRVNIGLVSYVYGGVEMLPNYIPLPNFWRAPISNDNGNMMQQRYAQWKIASKYITTKSVGRFEDTSPKVEELKDSVKITYKYHMPTTPASECQVSYNVFGDGTIETTLIYDPVKELGDMPEFGMMFKFNADYDNLKWYGLGPAETYADRKHAKLGIYSNKVEDNMAEYLVPQECGNKCGVRYAEITDLKGRGIRFFGDELSFSALPYTPHELENAAHKFELPQVHYTVVRVAEAQMGVAGDDSWGSLVHPEYLVDVSKKKVFTFCFRGI